MFVCVILKDQDRMRNLLFHHYCDKNYYFLYHMRAFTDTVWFLRNMETFLHCHAGKESDFFLKHIITEYSLIGKCSRFVVVKQSSTISI